MPIQGLIALRNGLGLAMLLLWLAAWPLLPHARRGPAVYGMLLVSAGLLADVYTYLVRPRLRWTSPLAFHATRAGAFVLGCVGGSLALVPGVVTFRTAPGCCIIGAGACAVGCFLANVALGERERDLPVENFVAAPPGGKVGRMDAYRLHYLAFRVVLSLATALCWSGACLALPYLRGWSDPAHVPTIGALGVFGALSAGLALDLYAAAMQWARVGCGDDRLNVAAWRTALSIGALLLMALAFPPTSVPVASTGVRLFAASTLLAMLGVAASIAWLSLVYPRGARD